MMLPVWMLVGFAALTVLLLLGTVGVYRWSRILTGRVAIREFRADQIEGAEWYKRAMRAHANCVENLPASMLKAEDAPIGLIAVDAIYSPVRKVAYKVDNARVGQQTDYDRLTIQIETDGSVGPEDAVGLAARIIQDQLSLFVNFEEPHLAQHGAGVEVRGDPRHPPVAQREDVAEVDLHLRPGGGDEAAGAHHRAGVRPLQRVLHHRRVPRGRDPADLGVQVGKGGGPAAGVLEEAVLRAIAGGEADPLVKAYADL